ncbi:cell filamentation protein Fic [Treponema rectale]|jgi:cell filamentation protein|uniref:protein adenylyltransferase n=1 Tax=Treponema rectale TaxID=744512 RepID=A0A7M1XJ92_9SPIR|nr:cell filamentation protein Fic [Treponema rectale]
MIKRSIRYFLNKPIRAIWDSELSKWWYSATDVVLVLTDSKNPRIYWNAIKRRNPELHAFCRQLRLYADDGKKYLADVVDETGIKKLGRILRSKNNIEFEKWLDGSLDPIDEQSKKKAYDFYKAKLIEEEEIGKTIALQKIHAYLFEGLYPFAGKIRTRTISKGGFTFANGDFLPQVLKGIDKMADNTFDEIVDKYIEMNIAHPFMEGNGRSTRIWLDLLLINRLSKCVDWSLIEKNDYMNAMRASPYDPEPIHKLLNNALTDNINDRELFLKGIDCSYYYEEEE